MALVKRSKRSLCVGPSVNLMYLYNVMYIAFSIVYTYTYTLHSTVQYSTCVWLPVIVSYMYNVLYYNIIYALRIIIALVYGIPALTKLIWNLNYYRETRFFIFNTVHV